ncbi:serine/threonine-protein kinase [Kitasatospora sp. NPDC057015]|uniref:serine/threonine-protein kinase n=1 Tax=Kitasatospora sp. NPDC057015 TaxID=3346001 RepID=UPI0036323861
MTVTAGTSTGTLLFANRYRVSSVLGRGGGADVLRAVDERLDRPVALKVFRPDAAVEDSIRRFGAEARVLARLRHPGLIEVYDYGVVAEHPYLVLELVEGPTLAALLRSRTLQVSDVRRLGHELARTLAFVHTHGVVHRDVKPSNVLVDATGRARLADFGAARLLGRQSEPCDEALTRTGLIVGTPAYLAPEQIRGQGALASADVYSLGLLLIECLTGNREYTGAPIEAAIARLHRPPVIPPQLPRDLAALLLRMTSMDPARRPSAEDCARLLGAPRPETRAAGAVAPPAGQLRASGRPPRVRAAVLAAAWALLLAGLGGSGALGDGAQASQGPTAVPAAVPPVDAAPAPSQAPPGELPHRPQEAAAHSAAEPSAAATGASANDDKQAEKARKHTGGHGKKPK